MVYYLDYAGLAKTLRGIKNQLDTKINNASVSITNGVITINGVTLTPVTDVSWDSTTHTLTGTKNGAPFNIVVGGANNGIAFLDANGKVDPSQLPAFIDDIVDGFLAASSGEDPNNYHTSTGGSHTYNVGDIVCDDRTSTHKYYYVNTQFTSSTFNPENCTELIVFPNPGQKGKIYYDVKQDISYRWSGTAYVAIIAHAGSTDEIPEGSTNLYFTNARAIAALSQALAAKADLNGAATEDFNVDDLFAAGGIAVGVSQASPNGVANLTSDGQLKAAKVCVNQIGGQNLFNTTVSSTITGIVVNSVLKSLIGVNKQPNVAYIIEDDDTTNPGLLDPLDTSELYDAFATAGITLGANKTEGMAILDGTTPVGE